MRTLGQNPTETELQDMLNIMDSDGNGKVQVDDFLSMMEQNIDKQLTDQLTQDQVEEFREAFNMFERANGTMALKKLGAGWWEEHPCDFLLLNCHSFFLNSEVNESYELSIFLTGF